MDFLSLRKLIKETDVDKDFLESLGLEFKTINEIKTYISFIDFLEMNLSENILKLSYFSDGFRFGYPQIGKEFDLLRLGTNFNINIEYKERATTDKLKEQLEKNKYYLEFLPQQTYYFSYCMNTKEFIKGIIDTNGDICFSECSADDFISILEEQTFSEMNHINYDDCFSIKNYLVSPFNDTERFYKNSYLLTSHQENIKKEIISSRKNIFLVQGKPGTGKSLLMYDIAKEFIHNGKKEEVLIIHTGKLNNGHRKLIEKGFNVLPIKQYKKDDVDEKTKYILIDESQRLKLYQLKSFIEYSDSSNVKFVFFADQEQTLHKSEENGKICEKLISHINSNQIFKLKSKMRSNIEMAQFILKIFTMPLVLSNKERIGNSDKKIEIKYFEDYDSAKVFMHEINKMNFVTLGFTSSLYNIDPFDDTPQANYVAHDVIGQEFDNVVVLLDNNFRYKQRGNNYRLLGTSRSYYHSTKMFYQNITRVREKLIVIVVGNPDVFVKISSVLKFFISAL